MNMKKLANKFWKDAEALGIRAFKKSLAEYKKRLKSHSENIEWCAMHDGDTRTAGSALYGAAIELDPHIQVELKSHADFQAKNKQLAELIQANPVMAFELIRKMVAKKKITNGPWIDVFKDYKFNSAHKQAMEIANSMQSKGDDQRPLAKKSIIPKT